MTATHPGLSAESLSIPALVIRHAGDAAFYWSQWDASAYSPLVNQVQREQLARLLRAHLDGLRVAGRAGWDRALAELTRWQGAGETFVATLLALESADSGARLKAIWEVVQRDPQRMLRGLISGFAWSDAQKTLPWIAHWSSGADIPAPLQVAALRALRLVGSAPPLTAPVLQSVLSSSEASVRAAACRLLGANVEQAPLAALLADPDRAVRAEAALAGIQAGYAQCLPALRDAVIEQAAEYARLTGRPKHDALRRLTRWVRHLGINAPMGQSDIPALLQKLEPRQSLLFILHHGDCRLLPTVESYLDHPEAARLAGWVWSMLTGIDLQAAGLCHPPRVLEGEPRPTDDLDPGLPDPDRQLICAGTFSPQSEQPTLLGQPLTPAHLQALLDNAPMALRWIVSQRLHRAN